MKKMDYFMLMRNLQQRKNFEKNNKKMAYLMLQLGQTLSA
jgi:hypothetical protein